MKLFSLILFLSLSLSPAWGQRTDCPPPSLSFFGAAQTIFGSCHLLDTGKQKFLLDCGLFQDEGLMEEEEIERRNRELLFDPTTIDAIFITHAHSDHVGRLPWLVKNGFSGPVYCTPTTAELSRLMLELYAWIFSRGNGFYSEKEGARASSLFIPQPIGKWFIIPGGYRARFLEAGHVLGSAMVELHWDTEGKDYSLIYTGDLGNPHSPLIRATEVLPQVDFLLLESTYGDRLHPNFAEDIDLFRNILNDTLSRGGKVLIPAYIMARSQKMLYFINELVENNLIPSNVSVYVDSAYANKVSAIYRRHPELYDEEAKASRSVGDLPLSFRGLKEYRPQENIQGPAIIIAPSGAVSTGKILTHLARYLSDPRSAVIFVGYQAEGGLGRQLLAGATSVNIRGKRVPVRAKSYKIGAFSGHPDYLQILAWLGRGAKPGRAFVLHGQPESAQNLAGLLKNQLGISAQAPVYGECVSLRQDQDRPFPLREKAKKIPGL